MKRFTPIILAALLGTGSVLAFSQNADASPYDWDRYHYNHDRDRYSWRDREAYREHERRERIERERRREWCEYHRYECYRRY